MTKTIAKWLTVVWLVGAAFPVEAGCRDSSGPQADQAQWDQLLRSVGGVREADLLSSRSPSTSAQTSEHFSIAEAECSANAVALLNVNGRLKSTATAVRLGWKEAWDGKTVIFLLRSYAGSGDFLFACLVGKDGELQRTRLVRPTERSKSSAVEIDASHYVYSDN